MKQKISKEQVIKDLRGLFAPISENSRTKFGDKSFLIDKIDYERYDVIAKLQDYFSDKVIDGGAIKISPITLRFTVLEVADI